MIAVLSKFHNSFVLWGRYQTPWRTVAAKAFFAFYKMRHA